MPLSDERSSCLSFRRSHRQNIASACRFLLPLPFKFAHKMTTNAQSEFSFVLRLPKSRQFYRFSIWILFLVRLSSLFRFVANRKTCIWHSLQIFNFINSLLVTEWVSECDREACVRAFNYRRSIWTVEQVHFDDWLTVTTTNWARSKQQSWKYAMKEKICRFEFA